jgi:uncharacterized protein
MMDVLLPLLARGDGAPAWVELVTPDPDRAKGFYGALLGWTFAGDGNSDRIDAFLDGDQVAGISLTPPGSEWPAGWLTYLAASDVDTTATGAVQLGATVLLEPVDLPARGRAAIVRDPTGAAVGLWQAGGHPGAEVIYQPGAACWHELLTDDLDESDAFYTGLFPLTLHDIDDGTSVLRLNHHPVGGRRRIAGQSRWQTYFWVEDIEGAVARTAELGGAVRSGPTSTHHGPLAEATDPFGAHFTVIAPTGW